MNVFLDTNIFLSFYHLTNDDLEELRKLKVMLEKQKVVLYLPSQTIDEYWRNRENKIAAALKSLKDQNLKLQFPVLCKDYKEYDTLRELQKELGKQHSSLVSQIASDIEHNSLKADIVIAELFAKATQVDTSEAIVEKARLRMSVGNPPGKDGSLGDAINWEALLLAIPDDDDLYLIADDRDYFSVLNENKPKEFLVREWDTKKHGQIFFYRRLAPFFSDHYPDIKLASELEKEMAVQQLVTSGAFMTTHSAISKLSGFENFSESQAREIADAALLNSQVNWILSDDDVHEFMAKFVSEYKDKLDPETYAKLAGEVKENEPAQVDEDIPF